MHAAAQRVEKLGRGDGRHIAFALQRQLFRIHRVGDVDREHDLDVDVERAGRPAAGQIGKPRGRRKAAAQPGQGRQSQRDQA
jgi:hypothetical protein